jgi:hypothetical protein
VFAKRLIGPDGEFLPKYLGIVPDIDGKLAGITEESGYSFRVIELCRSGAQISFHLKPGP